MNTLNVMLSNLDGRVIPLGYEGENLYTRVRINCIEVFTDYPDAEVSMVVNPPVGDMYPAVVEKTGVMVVWDITDSVLSSSGQGQAQITFTEDEVIRKSVVFGININSSLVAEGEPPEPVQEWIDNAEATAHQIAYDAAMEAAEEVIESIPEDYTNLSNDVNDLKTAKAPCVYSTASGSIASFSDGADGMPLKSIAVGIDPVQDLHGQEAPYPAGGTANKWDEECESGSLNVTSGAESPSADQIRAKNYMPVTAGATYYVLANPGIWVLFFDSSKNVLSSGLPSGAQAVSNARQFQNRTMEIPSDCSYIRFYFQSSYGTSYKHDTAINFPATVTTYAPYSNICPISGHSSATVTRTGVNLLNLDRAEGTPDPSAGSNTTSPRLLDVTKLYKGLRSDNYYYPQYATYSISDGVITVTNADNNAYGVAFPVAVQPGQKYTLSTVANSNALVTLGYYSEHWEYKGNSIATGSFPATFTIPDGVSYITIVFRAHVNSTATYSNVMFEMGETSHNYEPYQAQTVTIPLGQTVYGGTLDAVAGTLTVDRVGADIEFTEMYDRPGNDAVSFAVGAVPYAWNNISTNILFESGKYSTSSYSTTTYGDIVAYNTPVRKLAICCPRGYTTEQAQAFFSGGNKIVYELASPVVVENLTVQQIQTLLGVNNLFADTGNVSVTYPADTKMYIDNAITQAIAAALNA